MADNEQMCLKTMHGRVSPSSEIEARQWWMSVLAVASTTDLDTAWERLELKPRYVFLRPPEIGLAMVQAKIGGTGRPFNLGEMTITRCSVCVEGGCVGHAYVSGRRPRHAELAAVFDAILQDPVRREAIVNTVIHPLGQKEERHRERDALETAATKVDFFTLVRGDE